MEELAEPTATVGTGRNDAIVSGEPDLSNGAARGEKVVPGAEIIRAPDASDKKRIEAEGLESGDRKFWARGHS